MFFLISKHIDKTFPNNKKFGNYYVSFDNGWNIEDNFIYKGLIFSGKIDIIKEQEILNYKNIEGTFCIIHFTDNKININFGIKQKFPIFINDDSVTNLYKADKFCTNLSEVIISDEKIQPIYKSAVEYQDLKLSDDEIINRLDQTIENHILNFNTNKPFKLYLTGGLDTLLIAAYVLKNKIEYELVSGEHAEMDHFLCYHRSRLMKDFWAYQTIQHWKKSTILLTGAHGDETLLRDPLQALLILKHHGEDLINICRENVNLYQSKHCLKEQNLVEYKKYDNLKFESDVSLKNYIMNTFAGDYQHWHLGNTLFYTPFDDLELLNLSLNLSYDVARKQLLDGFVAKELIKKNRPGLLRLLSSLKNFDYYENLASLYEGKISLEEI